MDTDKPPQKETLQISTGDEMSRGRYSNNLLVSHTQEEFIFDWLLNSLTGVHLISRIIVSPGHLKRIIDTLKENLTKYEDKYGAIPPTQPEDQKISTSAPLDTTSA
jgi:Protein of unknown function (DUF3467)